MESEMLAARRQMKGRTTIDGRIKIVSIIDEV